MCVGACTRAHVILFPLEVGGDFLMLFIVICVCLCGFSGHSTIQVILVFKCVRARACTLLNATVGWPDEKHQCPGGV